MPYPKRPQHYRNPTNYNHTAFMKKITGFISERTRKLFFCEGRQVERGEKDAKKQGHKKGV